MQETAYNSVTRHTRGICILCDRPIRGKRALFLQYDAPPRIVIVCLPCCERALDQDEPEQDLKDFMKAQCCRDPTRYIRTLVKVQEPPNERH